MIERINFWGLHGGWHTLAVVITYVALPLCALVMLVRLYLRIRLWWKVGRPEPRWDQLGLRGQRLLKYAIAQVKVWRQAYPGLMHFGLAWGFFIFFVGTALATIDADIVKFLRGPLYLGYKVLLDVFTVLFLAGFVLAGYRRFVQRPERLTLTAPFALALVLIFLIVLTGLTTESLRLASIARQPDLQPGWRPALAWITPAGWVLAQLWLALGLSVPAMKQLHLGTWLVHAGLVALFFITLPTSSLVHVITSPLNVFFSKLGRPAGRLAPTIQRDGAAGVATLCDFTWKQLMDADACTECGRCQDACPAYASGQPLSPKKVILAIKNELALHGSALAALRGNGSAKLPAFTGEAVEDAATWACTTCRACVAECPVLIEHVDAIVDLRRHLLAQQRADNQLTGALGNLRRYGNSFGKSDKQRAKWTTGLDFKIKDVRKQAAHTLWFVGDYVSYSPALTEVTQTTARVFQQAGLDFGILYDAERNAGNDVRRAGEEGLFELLSQKNLAAFQKCQFEQIVTTDPHTYNTLKNEYVWTNGQTQPLSAHLPVLHYTELLEGLIRNGKLALPQALNDVVTYHDPCYLGRYNEIYDAPRRVLAALGCRLIEMPRNRERALCCGAGGGRIWMDEGKVKERPSESRVREAAALRGVQVFVVACPKDLTMYRDAVKTAGLEGRLIVKDLIELVAEACGTGALPAAASATNAGATPVPQ
jgi:Fe-S oxidoreductase/nitrate reductase gamma subunit